MNPDKYKGLANGFKVSVAEGGMKALSLGWAPTLVGYSMQGIGKFGFYEAFKNFYSGLLGEVFYNFEDNLNDLWNIFAIAVFKMKLGIF